MSLRQTATPYAHAAGGNGASRGRTGRGRVYALGAVLSDGVACEVGWVGNEFESRTEQNRLSCHLCCPPVLWLVNRMQDEERAHWKIRCELND